MSDSGENSEELLHPRPHFVAAVVDCAVLVVEGDGWRVELQAAAGVVACGVDGGDVLVEESLGGGLGAGCVPLRPGDVAG